LLETKKTLSCFRKAGQIFLTGARQARSLALILNSKMGLKSQKKFSLKFLGNRGILEVDI